jgi:hypothetical protein
VCMLFVSTTKVSELVSDRDFKAFGLFCFSLLGFVYVVFIFTKE